jgi:hypothetical protein
LAALVSTRRRQLPTREGVPLSVTKSVGFVETSRATRIVLQSACEVTNAPSWNRLDIGAGAAGLRLLDDVVELAACGHACCQPAVATVRIGELVIMPLGRDPCRAAARSDTHRSPHSAPLPSRARTRRRRIGQGSSPCSMPPQSRGQTAPMRPNFRRPRPGPGAGSANRRR